MNQSLLHQMLNGDEEAAAMFGETETCAVIDWRDEPSEIVAAISSFLPDEYLTVGHVTAASCELLVQGKPPITASLTKKATQENFLLSINRAIEPAYELRQFRPCDGDGFSIFVAPQCVWSEIDKNPQAAEKLFLNANRLAAFWSKSYFARLFSKP